MSVIAVSVRSQCHSPDMRLCSLFAPRAGRDLFSFGDGAGQGNILWHRTLWDGILSLAVGPGTPKVCEAVRVAAHFLLPWLQVALLCGSPGLGKTTLAHVIARHAGYCVVEMNAR